MASAAESTTADLTINQCEVIAGAVGNSYKSFKKANFDYMEQNFPGWQEEKKTFEIPPRYESKSRYMSQRRANNRTQSRSDDSDRRGEQAEVKVVNMFTQYGRTHAQPMFVFHSFKFEKLVSTWKRLKLKLGIQLSSKETDVIIVHRNIGVIVVEIKAMERCQKNTYKKVMVQVENTEKLLNKLSCVCSRKVVKKISDSQSYNNAMSQLVESAEKSHNKAPVHARILVKKVIACPSLQVSELTQSNSREFIYLCKDDLKSELDFANWWLTMIEPSTQEAQDLCNIIYLDLVPKLLCGRGDICIFLSLSSVDDIDKQVSVFKCENNVKQLKFVCKCLYLTPEQCNIWDRCKQVISGPYGSGKTILLQCKAMELARGGHAVLVIVPLHLKPAYEKFFADNLKEKKRNNIEVFSVEEFCKNFSGYEVLARVSHVFVDELLWRYKNSSSSSSGELTYYGNTKTAYYKHERGKSHLVSATRSIRHYIESVRADTEDHRKKSEIKLLDMLHYLFKCDNDLHVWIVPSVFAMLSKVLVNQAPYEVYHFEELFSIEPVSELNTIMRTCREVHEHITRAEFKGFCTWCKYCDDAYFDKISTDNRLRIMFGGFLGHSIPGNKVEVVSCLEGNFLIHCLKTLRDTINRLLGYKSIIRNNSGSFKLIQTFKPRFIAVIAKTQEEKYIKLDTIMDIINKKQKDIKQISDKKWYLCTIQEYHSQNDEYGIPICYSKDVASLEWPVVIHIRYSKTVFMYEGGFITNCPSIEEEDNVIPSRCMLYYILICREDEKIPGGCNSPKSIKECNDFADLFKLPALLDEK